MFSVTQAWNEFLYANTFLRSDELFTLPVGLAPADRRGHPAVG